MRNFFEKIAVTDFRKAAKCLLVAALIVVLAGGALTAGLMRTQISELATLEKNHEQGVQQVEKQWQEKNRGEEGDRQDEEFDLFDSGLISRLSVTAMVVAVAYAVLCGLCALAYWLMVAAWLCKASTKAGMNRALWTILGLLGNLVAVAAFLIVRERMVCCTKCGTRQKPAHYCVSCGAALYAVCPKCGKICAETDKFCSDCGTFLSAAAENAENEES